MLGSTTSVQDDLPASQGTSAIKWMTKLNSHIFQLEVEEKRGGVTIEEDEGCRPGFFCMFFEDDGFDRNIEENEKFAKEETIEVLEKVEYNTRVKQIILCLFDLFKL